jgi:4'-phosphopantetheinyl transferase
MTFPPLDRPRRVRDQLGPRRIHLWAARLDPPAAEVVRLHRLLDADEQAKAARFRFDKHRRRFIVGRGFQRIVLGDYLGVDAAEIELRYGPKGKPYLAGPWRERLHFNLSNSSEMALLGVNVEREIGVDIEKLREVHEMEQLAERFFSRREAPVLLALPEERKIEGFFNCWTRKEAYLKAVGTGLSAPLDRFDVTLEPGAPPRMLALEESAEKAASWSLCHLEPAEGYLGAFAIEVPELERSGWRIESWTWCPYSASPSPASPSGVSRSSASPGSTAGSSTAG